MEAQVLAAVCGHCESRLGAGEEGSLRGSARARRLNKKCSRLSLEGKASFCENAANNHNNGRPQQSACRESQRPAALQDACRESKHSTALHEACRPLHRTIARKTHAKTF